MTGRYYEIIQSPAQQIWTIFFIFIILFQVMQGLQQLFLKTNSYSSKYHYETSDEIILLLPVRAQQFFVHHS